MLARRLLLVLVSVSALAAAAVAQPKAPAKPPTKLVKGGKPVTTRPAGGDESAHIARVLAEEKIADIRFNQHEFRDVVDYFRENFGLNIYVEWKALEAAGLHKSTPVTLNLQNVTVERALQVVLDDLGGQARPLAYIVEKGILVISTKASLAARASTKIYPAADLLCRTRRAFTEGTGYPWRISSFLPLEPEPTSSSGGGDSSIFAEESTGLSRRAFRAGTEEAAEQLISLIKNTIDRDSWGDPQGGGAGMGMIQVIGTSLVVTQNYDNHQAVSELLELLRADRDSRRTRLGVAVLRSQKADVDKTLREALAKGGDPTAALTSEADKGTWVLDRCKTEELALGDVIQTTNAYARSVRSAPFKQIILPHTTLYGYEIGVLPKSREKDKLSVSVACGSGWITKDEDPSQDTPENTTGVRSRHNIFDFTLAPGEARFFAVTPAEAKDGCVKVVVWLPKEAK